MSASPAAASEESYSELRRWLIFAGAVFPTTVYVGTQTVANAVLPQMQGDLSASLDQIAWVVTASVVASAIGVPPTAWLTARFGRRRLIVACMILFSIASLMVGVAESLGGVVFWRAAAALSAAPVTALSQAVALDLFPEDKRGLAFSFWAVGVLSGWIFAPAVGAYVSEVSSWRLIFFLLSPVALLGALTASAAPDTGRNPSLRFDWFAFATLSLGIASLLLVLNRGQRLDWFASPEVIAFTVLGAAALYVFVVHSAMSERPLIDLAIFKDPNFSLGLAVVSTYAALSLAPLVLIPTMLEELRGLELLTTGLLLIPRGAGQIAGLIVVGILVNRADARIFIVGGFVVFALSARIMAGYNLEVGIWDVVWPNLLQGFAMGFIWAPLANLIYANLTPQIRTDAVTFVSLVYTLSSSIGVSLAVTVLTRTFQVSHEELAGRLSPQNEVLRFADWSGGWDFSSLAGLAAMKSEVAQQALMIAYVNVFWGTLIYALAVIPFALFLRKR